MIDYETLTDAYKRSLMSVLRGFRPGDFQEAFLETWVPDEDDAKSVRAIFEAAAAANVPRLALRIGPATLARVPAVAFEAVAVRLGSVCATRKEGALLLDLTFDSNAANRGAREMRPSVPAVTPVPLVPARAGTPRPPVPPMSERAAAYDAAIRAIGPFTHEGPLPQGEGTAIAVAHEGATLEVLVGPGAVLVAARHRGGVGDVPAVLEALARTIESLPLREAADHGVARLELILRGRAGARVVPGIVSPTNADPRVAACVATLRALLAEHARRGGNIEAKNEFVPPLRAAWAAAAPAEREARVREALPSIAADLDLPRGAIDLATIHGDTRVVLAFDAGVPPARRPELLFAIERALKDRLDDGLTVYLEEMADKNRIRRLVVKPGEARGRAES